MKKLMIITLLPLFVSGFLTGEKLSTLNEVLKPDSMAMDRENIYVTEGADIFIYSKGDFKLKTTFGKKGEGPAEFIPRIFVFPRENKLLVTSRDKLSFFSRTGAFIRSEKPAGYYQILPLGDGYMARGSAIQDNRHFITVNFIDKGFRMIKELGRMQSLGQQGKKIRPLKGKLIHSTCSRYGYLAHYQGFHIQVFDSGGTLLHTIKEDEKKVRVPFTSADEKAIRDYFKGSNPQFYEGIRTRLAFPDFFPPVRDLYASGNRLYVMTYGRKGENTEFRVYSREGKFLKSLWIPVRFIDVFRPGPLVFFGDSAFTLVENSREEWELHRFKVD